MKAKINKTFFAHFDEFSLSTELDAVASSFAFAMKFEKEDKNHVEICRPLAYYPVEVLNDDEKVFLTGTITNHDFGSSSVPNRVVVSGYSKAGILEDVTIPYSKYPIENLKSSIDDVCKKLLPLYGISYVIDGSVKKECSIVMEKIVAEPTDTLKDFICKIAAEKNILVGHDIHGRIIFFRPNIKSKPTGFYTEKSTVEMSLSVDGRAMHSEISIVRQASKKNPDLTGAQTLKNPMVRQYRATVKTMSSGEETEVTESAKNVMSEELKAIRITLFFKEWKNHFVGEIIEIQNPEIYIFKRTRFLIQSTTISQSASDREMTIELVLPETYTGDTPKNIFA